MEVVIIIIIIGIIGYLIYQSLPSTKFNKAEVHFNAKNYIEAINILNEIFDKHIGAPGKFAECKFIIGLGNTEKSEKIKIFNEILELRTRINHTSSLAKFENIEAKVLLEIAKIQFEECKSDINKLDENLKFINNANKKGIETDFYSLKIKHYIQLAESYLKRAIDSERSYQYQEAIKLYKKAIEYSEKSSNSTIKYNSDARILICQLKLNESIDLKDNSEIKKADNEYQKDLFYRYSVWLLKQGRFQQAENIISTHLNFKSVEIEKLTDIIKVEKINNALNKLATINQKIEQLYDKSLSKDELSIFYNELDSIIAYLEPIDVQLSEKVMAIKPNLFNRLLTNYISSELYGNAINLIQKYPKFWESPELLKNLAICCYCFTSKGMLTEKNYKIIISSWLTSVYSDNVILKCLENTSWDDNYTFSLAESIGTKYSQHTKIPKNVNYDEVSENNISIGSTQRHLIQQFETIIHKEIQDINLSILVNDFYNKEKNAIEKVIEIIESDILFPTPHFAITNDLNNEIIEELDSDYEEYSNEEALEAGLRYINNSTSSIVYQYYYANDLIERIESAIDYESLASIKELNTTENIEWLEKFDNVSSALEDRLYNKISAKISENDENKAIIALMEECISISRNNEKLKHQYSNYVASYCISQVNAEKIDNFEALSLMKKAYLRSPNNPRICKNLITLIKFNLMDVLNDRTMKIIEIYKILDWVKSNMSQTYKYNNIELSNTRKEILGQLKANGVDISLFEDNGISSIRSDNSLNSQGLKMKKVLNYLRDMGSVQEANNPFDRIRHLRQQLNLDDNSPF
jgi:hypothetical protein